MNKPLNGIRVLEMGQLIAGPFAAKMLGEFGAEVIKIEPPGQGDPLRNWRLLHAGTSVWWQVQSRNKQSVTLDLRQPEIQAVVRRLVAECDVVVENFKPGTLESWGLGWDELRAVATDAMQRAYAPYSRYRVGAAALVSDGRIVSGCNVENASYGVGLCAECALVGDLHMSGGGQLVAFVCVNNDGETIMPCGRCRQLLNEFALPGMLLETVSGIRTIDEVLPDAFGPRDLEEVSR